MTDKELIKQEIEKQIDYAEDDTRYTESYREGLIAAYQTIKAFIDSLPEESASEDLEEEIDRFAKTVVPSRSKTITKNNISLCAKHFAHWQHGKDFDDLLQSEMKFPKEFYEKGRFDMREEMMKDAVDGEYWDGSIYLDNRPTEYKDGDKVKIIIVKENG